MFNDSYKGRKVLVTGHTGFKGSWLVLWLLNLGADIYGYSLEPPTQPNHHSLLRLDIESISADIRDFQTLLQAVRSFKPEIVFHLAAQSIVLKSYYNPIETFQTNILGTGNILEACRRTDTVRAIIIVTSDKCYEERKDIRAYRETDPLGGHDPYSTSKGCAELLTASYRKSYFNPQDYYDKHQTLVASARAGNVIGGGDWAEDRLIPDIMKAASKHKKVRIRNPYSTRPWQHVLDALAGYLLLGQGLLEGKSEFSGPWNFGPKENPHGNVISIVEALQHYWANIQFETGPETEQFYEADLLQLDCSKARNHLGWQQVWMEHKIFEKTALWYRHFYESDQIISQNQLLEFLNDAKSQKVVWILY